MRLTGARPAARVNHLQACRASASSAPSARSRPATAESSLLCAVAIAALLSGAVTLGLRGERAPGGLAIRERDGEAVVAGGDLDLLAADLAEQNRAEAL